MDSKYRDTQRSNVNQPENNTKDSVHSRYSPPVSEPPASEHRSFRAIFQLRSAVYPWKKAILASLSMGFSLLAGAVAGKGQVGR